jgi:hypothetical protein
MCFELLLHIHYVLCGNILSDQENEYIVSFDRALCKLSASNQSADIETQ